MKVHELVYLYVSHVILIISDAVVVVRVIFAYCYHSKALVQCSSSSALLWYFNIIKKTLLQLLFLHNNDQWYTYLPFSFKR